MTKRWLQLVKTPGIYFETFRSAPSSWLVAYVGFYMVTFVESVGNRAFSDVPPPAGTILGRSLMGALGAAVVNAALFGILWLWVGSKLVRGKASLSITTKACGYAFLYPSILGLLTVPPMLWLSGEPVESTWLPVLGTVVLQFGAGLWALGMALVAMKRLNGFGWGKTLVVATWLPGLFFVVIFLFFALP